MKIEVYFRGGKITTIIIDTFKKQKKKKKHKLMNITSQ